MQLSYAQFNIVENKSNISHLIFILDQSGFQEISLTKMSQVIESFLTRIWSCLAKGFLGVVCSFYFHFVVKDIEGVC